MQVCIIVAVRNVHCTVAEESVAVRQIKFVNNTSITSNLWIIDTLLGYL